MKLYSIFFMLILLLSCKQSTKVDRTKILPFYNSEDFTPEWIAKENSNYSKIHKIAPFEFQNQNGEIITNKNFKGKIYIADFFFTTCPSICPILAKNMASIQEEYKNDTSVLLLSHTVMPWVDSIKKIKEYATEKKAIDGKWHLVTGERNTIYDLARTSYFADDEYKESKNKNDFIHTENFILVDAKGRIRGVYNGTLPVDIQRLKRHINLLKEELF